jgi:hypothetical protein
MLTLRLVPVRSDTAPPGSGYSDVGSVTPSTYSSEIPQLDPSLKFFGQNSGYDFNQHFHDQKNRKTSVLCYKAIFYT